MHDRQVAMMGLKGLPGMCEAQSDHALGEHGDVFLTAATKKLQRVILELAGDREASPPKESQLQRVK